MKVALYARVSTEEQAKHGLSIDTQLDNLRAWAKAQGHTVVGEYVDPGVSARKPPTKRPALQQLLSELDGIELIAFTRLDRWTRNIKGYYDVQAVLDAHRVAWAAILEDYETVSSAGRFKVNIMLSINEAESDRTGERIKTVFDRKIANGEYIGDHVPLGLSVVDKHLVPNEDADIVRECFRLFRRSDSIYRVRTFLHDNGFPLSYAAVRRLLQKPMYSGQYRGNPNYCPAIIPQEEWDEVQRMLEERSVRENPTRRVYLFSGLIRCAECGRRMAGAWATHGNDNFMYRCNGYYLDHKCGNKRHVRESAVEAWLLDNVAAELKKMSVVLGPLTKKKRGPDKAAIMAKVDRLQELYVEGMIDREKFRADREKLLAQLPQEQPVKDLAAARQIVLADDFRERYNELPREDKRLLWRSVVGRMEADAGGNIHLFF